MAGDVGDGELAGLAGGEVAGFPGFAGAAAVGAVADCGVRQEDFQQERGEGEFRLFRGQGSWFGMYVLSTATVIPEDKANEFRRRQEAT